MSTRETMLNIARQVIGRRAEIDGYVAEDYDATTDPEGYIISILNALHRWCDECGMNWSAELARAQELFDEDGGELRNRQSKPLDTAEECPAEWDGRCQRQALAQGWGLFSTERGLDIQRYDEKEMFFSDEEAAGFVKGRASMGCPLARLALHTLKATAR